MIVGDADDRAAWLYDHFVRLDDEVGKILTPDELARSTRADIDDAEVGAAGVGNDDRVLVAAEGIAGPHRDAPRLPTGGRDSPGDKRGVGDLEDIDTIQRRVGQVQLAPIGVVNGVHDAARSL